MHAYLTHLFWYGAGRYGAVAVFLAGSWLAGKLKRRQRRLSRSRRERLSASPATDPGWINCPGCPVAYGPHLHARTDQDEPATCMHGVTSPCGLCGEFGQPMLDSGRPESGDWITCPSCGREDVAARTMRDGVCIRCWTLRNEHAPMA